MFDFFQKKKSKQILRITSFGQLQLLVLFKSSLRFYRGILPLVNVQFLSMIVLLFAKSKVVETLVSNGNIRTSTYCHIFHQEMYFFNVSG